MSERTYALMNLRKFIKQRALARKKWKPLPDMPEHMIEDNLLAIKCRTDEDRIIMAEIDRVLKFKPSGRREKAPGAARPRATKERKLSK